MDQELITEEVENLLGEGIFDKMYLGSICGTPAAVKKIRCGIEGMEERDICHEINGSLIFLFC